MTKAIEDAANALAIRTALGVPTNAELAAVSGVANAAYVKPANGIPHNDLHVGILNQLDLADTSLQPGVLPVNTTVTAAQISDAGAAGRTLLQKATLPEIQSLVSGYNAALYPVGSIMSDIAAQYAYSPDFVFAVASDSTGNEDDEKIRRLANHIAAAFPGAYVDYRIMNTATDLYGAAVKLSTGGSEPSVTVAADMRGWANVAANATDIDVRVDCALTSWASGANQILACQYGNAGSRAWYLRVSGTGTLVMSWLEADGVTARTYFSAALGFTAGTRQMVRCTVDVDNGASGHSVAFYKSADGGVTWTQIGTTQTTAGVSSVFQPAGQVHEIGSRGAGSGANAGAGVVEGAIGTYYYAHYSPEIGGYNRYPENIRDWRATFDMLGARSAGAAIRFYNGAYPGQNLAYFTSGVRAERIFPRVSDNAAVILNTSHNEGSTFQDGVFENGAAALKARINSRIGNYRGVISSQNPQRSPSTTEQIYAQMRRCTRSIPAVAGKFGWLLSDEYRLAVWSDPAAINADGKHPDGIGRAAQGDCLIRACGGAV